MEMYCYLKVVLFYYRKCFIYLFEQCGMFWSLKIYLYDRTTRCGLTSGLWSVKCWSDISPMKAMICAGSILQNKMAFSTQPT